MKIYAARIYEIQTAEVEKLCGLLDRNRLKKVSELKNEKEKVRSIFAGLLLRYAFFQAGYDIKMWQQVEIEKGAYGKPQIRGNHDLHYSLSHSGEWVVCAVDTMPVGADIQEMKSWQWQLAKKFYHKDEYNRLLALKEMDTDRQTKEFYSMWTAKESVVKQIGRGIGAGISQYVTAEDYHCIYDKNRNEVISIKLYDELEGYIACACSKLGNFPKKLELINILIWAKSQMEGNRC